MELEGSQDLDVSQSLNAKMCVMVHVDGLLLIVEPQWHLLSGMPHCPDGSGRFKV